MKRGFLTMSAVALLVVAAAESAFAQGGHPAIGPGLPGSGLGLGALGVGGMWGWGPWLPGYPNDPWGYTTGRIPTPPYFAIHPPVYYGRRVGMPYGNSTVTRPPRPVLDDSLRVGPFQTPAIPRMIENPYVQDAEPAAADVATNANGAVIENPHVSKSRSAKGKRDAKEAGRSPARNKSVRDRQKSRKRKG